MEEIALIAVLASTGVLAQTSSYRPEAPHHENSPTLRVDANLVLVPVTVADRRGNVVPTLKRSNFRLTEEKRSQELASFSHENAPVSLGFVVDLSGSMRDKIEKVQDSVKAFLDSLEPEDEDLSRLLINRNCG